jgi:hypothetical protein
MAKMVITAVNVVNGEVEGAVVNSFVRGKAEGSFGIDVGKAFDRAELANLAMMDELYVVKEFKDGMFDLGCRVRRKPGPMEYLESYTSDGQSNNDLLKLPRFNVIPEEDE